MCKVFGIMSLVQNIALCKYEYANLHIFIKIKKVFSCFLLEKENIL